MCSGLRDLETSSLLVAIFTNEAELAVTSVIIPLIASLRPDVDTLIATRRIVRLSVTPRVEVHETVRPQFSRLRRHARSTCSKEN